MYDTFVQCFPSPLVLSNQRISYTLCGMSSHELLADLSSRYLHSFHLELL